MRRLRLIQTVAVGSLLAILLGLGALQAQEEKKEEPAKKEEAAKKEDAKQEGPSAKVLVTNLDNPCGVAVQPETGQVFVASRHGVYRYLPAEMDRKKRINIEILAAGKDVYGKGPMYDIGPLGLAFMNKDHLVVGDGSRVDGEELVRIYKIPATPPASPAQEDSAVYTLGPITAGEESEKGEGNFYGVAVGADAIFVTCNGDDTKGWISKIALKDGKPDKLAPAIATKVATEVDAPVGITFSPDGKELVVSQMGEMNIPNDSLLTFYDPATGELKKKYTTNLHDIAGLAYSPKTKNLYAVDFAWSSPGEGGLYKLTIDGDEVKSEKILSLDKPTALAFDKDGNLYITQFGTADENSNKSPGTLSVIKAEAGL